MLSRARSRFGPAARRRLLAAACIVAVVAATLFLATGASSSTNGAVPSDAGGSRLVAASASPAASTAATGQPATPRPTPHPTAVPPDQLSGYVWPLPNARVTLPFGPSSWGEFLVDGQLFHDGVDMATFCGDHGAAAHDGVVLAAGRHFDDFMGWDGDLTPYYANLDAKHAWNELPIMVVIDDGNGYRSLYAHFSSVVVKPGEQVRAGQLLGYEGMTGHASGCHLHYGLFSPYEPKDWLLEARVTLAMKLPGAETARIDPLLVLPYRHDVAEMQSLRPSDAAAWTPPPPTPTPSATPTPTPTPKPSRR